MNKLADRRHQEAGYKKDTGRVIKTLQGGEQNGIFCQFVLHFEKRKGFG
jgi:hypothetical protein